MEAGYKYRIMAISFMGEVPVKNVVEGTYLDTDTNGVFFFKTNFNDRVGYDPKLGWKFIPMEDSFWKRAVC
jgi:hypothetical protein